MRYLQSHPACFRFSEIRTFRTSRAATDRIHSDEQGKSDAGVVAVELKFPAGEK